MKTLVLEPLLIKLQVSDHFTEHLRVIFSSRLASSYKGLIDILTVFSKAIQIGLKQVFRYIGAGYELILHILSALIVFICYLTIYQ